MVICYMALRFIERFGSLMVICYMALRFAERFDSLMVICYMSLPFADRFGSLTVICYMTLRFVECFGSLMVIYYMALQFVERFGSLMFIYLGAESVLLSLSRYTLIAIHSILACTLCSPTESIPPQTWFLKVSIHCEGCRRKVKKVLKSIDGVFTATIDPHQQKVTVIGSVSVETLLKKLVRAGKHAEIWPENLDDKGNISGKVENKKKKNQPGKSQSMENRGTETGVTGVGNCNNSKKTAGDNSPEKSPASDNAPPEGGGGGFGKKKKKKAQNGNGSSDLGSACSGGVPAHTGSQLQNLVGQQMGQMNLSPTRQHQLLSYPDTYYTPMVYFATTYHDRLYPMARIGGPTFCVPSSPYICDQDSCQFQSASLISFEIFSDENANGCSIM
ncbi:hypothetical protein RJT34_14711 [Clitoria ternatea]|uniref:HMA domain-containing protein n=1 Tax=Clitoria ternatea TaxID=43366 RepID=A0AAN9JT34_CLITE